MSAPQEDCMTKDAASALVAEIEPILLRHALAFAAHIIDGAPFGPVREANEDLGRTLRGLTAAVIYERAGLRFDPAKANVDAAAIRAGGDPR